MNQIQVSTVIDKPQKFVWDLWTDPEHIVNWNFASEDWCCPSATVSLVPGGDFTWRMEARDESMGFDFKGVFVHIEPGELLTYRLDDGRMVRIEFKSVGSGTEIIEYFDPEKMNTEELQRSGWQAILDNFKKYAESL